MRNEGHICHIARGCRAIVSSSLAQKLTLVDKTGKTLNNAKLQKKVFSFLVNIAERKISLFCDYVM